MTQLGMIPAYGNALQRTMPANHTTHGLSTKFPREYRIWKQMRQRCSNHENHKYRYYGARGIRVCDRWNDFAAFIADMGPSDGRSIERKDTKGNYEPNNCRWATQKEQQNNRRNNVILTLDGVTKTFPQWAASIGLTESGLRSRLRRGSSVEEALTAKPKITYIMPQ